MRSKVFRFEKATKGRVGDLCCCHRDHGGHSEMRLILRNVAGSQPPSSAEICVICG